MDVTSSEGKLKFDLEHPLTLRIFLFVMGCVPLLAPYELLIKPRWTEFGFVFASFAVIALGALSVSFFLWGAALLGKSTTWTFSSDLGECIVVRRSPFARTSTAKYSFSELGDVRIHTIDWSEGEPSHYIHVMRHTSGETEERALEKIGPFKSGAIAQQALSALLRILGRAH